jgi:hypothetical protein
MSRDYSAEYWAAVRNLEALCQPLQRLNAQIRPLESRISQLQAELRDAQARGSRNGTANRDNCGDFALVVLLMLTDSYFQSYSQKPSKLPS